jgi:hypothetical protein
MSGMKMHCPRPDCKWMYFSNQIEDHCARRHGIKTGHNGAKAFLSHIYLSLEIVRVLTFKMAISGNAGLQKKN